MNEHIYNVTIVVSPEMEVKWMAWMKTVHIPEVMETGLFQSYMFTQVYPEQEQDQPSFSIQYRAIDLQSIQLYMEMYAPVLQEKSTKAWGNHALALRTILEVLDDK